MNATAWSHPAYENLAALVRERTGIVFGPGQSRVAEPGIRRAMAKARIADPEAYRVAITTAAIPLDDLVVELVVGETYFFRQPEHFDFLRREALAEIRRRKGPLQPLRAWSAGCASGEEPYSLAILLEEEGWEYGSYILATDISRTALDRAKAATYGKWSFRGVDKNVIARYFHLKGERFVLAPRFRGRVVFEYLNLATEAYPFIPAGTVEMDLILCRNVLIYFDPATIREVARRLYASLAPGGWLVTAPTDAPLGAEAPFETVQTPHGIYYRRGLSGPALQPAFETTSFEPVALPRWTDPPIPKEALRDPLADARLAFARAEYGRVLEATRGLEGDPDACALSVQARANLEGSDEAEKEAARAVERHPLSPELHFLHGIVLMTLGQDEASARSLRRAIYLEGSLAVAHFALGSVLRRLGEVAGARRAYRNARDVAAARPGGEILPLTGAEEAGRLVEAAESQLQSLEAVT